MRIIIRSVSEERAEYRGLLSSTIRLGLPPVYDRCRRDQDIHGPSQAPPGGRCLSRGTTGVSHTTSTFKERRHSFGTDLRRAFSDGYAARCTRQTLWQAWPISIRRSRSPPVRHRRAAQTPSATAISADRAHSESTNTVGTCSAVRLQKPVGHAGNRTKDESTLISTESHSAAGDEADFGAADSIHRRKPGRWGDPGRRDLEHPQAIPERSHLRNHIESC